MTGFIVTAVVSAVMLSGAYLIGKKEGKHEGWEEGWEDAMSVVYAVQNRRWR